MRISHRTSDANLIVAVALIILSGVLYIYVIKEYWVLMYVTAIILSLISFYLVSKSTITIFQYQIKDWKKYKSAWYKKVVKVIFLIIASSVMFIVFAFPVGLIYNGVLGLVTGIQKYTGDCTFYVRQSYSGGRHSHYSIAYRLIVPGTRDPLTISKSQYLYLGGNPEYTVIKDSNRDKIRYGGGIGEDFDCNSNYYIEYLDVLQGLNKVFELEKQQ